MNGILIVDKPTGWTSFDVVNFIRKRFAIQKAGHAGTLDPMATGVLVVLLGSATKLSGEFSGHDKDYAATMTLGIVTDTGDSEGKVIRTAEVPDVSRAEVETVLESFSGEISQIPPMVSAIKHNGTPLYKLARKGIEVERKPRSVTIHKIRLTDFRLPELSIEVSCSKGTYIRTLCEDIGERIGCGGSLSSLRRTRSGEFSIVNAVSIDELKEMQDADILHHQEAAAQY